MNRRYPTRRSPQHSATLGSTSVALLASLLAHGLPLLALSVLTQPPPSPPPQQREEVVPMLSKQQVERLLKRHKQRTRRPEPKPELPKPKPTPPSPKGQVVEIPPPPKEQVPERARLLSAFNSAVEREQVHANKRAPQPKVIKSERRVVAGGDDLSGERRGERGVKSSQRPRPSPPSPNKRPPKKRTPQERPPKERTTKRKARPQQQRPEKAQAKRSILEGEGPFKRVEEAREGQERPSHRPAKRPAQSAMGALAPTHYQSLLPTLGPEAMERSEGSLDHVPDVTQGQQTALNTREYRYAHFFNRVKREVAARWQAGEVYRAVDPQGNVYGVSDRHTIVSVTLYPNGALAELEIVNSSGVHALDIEALNAFQRAQPFHNPPKGLIDEDGKIRFKFGFFLEINGGGFRFLP